MKSSFALCFLLLTAAPAFAEDTLFADMGGQAGIDRMRAEFKVQFCQVAGGPCDYKGHDMTAAHKGLHLTNANFNAVVEDLQDAMDRIGLPSATQNRFLARLAPMQHQVVSR